MLFRSGGHNGSDELTTFSLIPMLRNNLKIPFIAAGGITDGYGIYSALSLGAEGVQIGTRFAATTESSANEIYKQKIVEAGEIGTALIFRKIGLIRTLKNAFSEVVKKAEDKGATIEELKELLGTKKEVVSIVCEDFKNGMQEAGQRRSEEHTSDLQSPNTNSYAVFCLKQKKKTKTRK